MDQHPSKVILTQMTQKQRLSWPEKQKHTNKRLLRKTSFFAAVSLCLCGCAWFAVSQPHRTEAVMSHLTAGFEYDETLGRLQLVNNMLPESAMVFLSTDSSITEFQAPVEAEVSHAWTQQEPWLEYASIGDVSACQDGEIITIVQNHAGTHTMRILHDNGYESIYSGLHAVHASENESVLAGQIIGTSAGKAAFELRKDGVSVLPAFSEI
ncbi:MAG: M23 family metallopeptidase [Clostridia bacterium]|nr:M23 family metallopeptidase [Clostridia bacterium]